MREPPLRVPFLLDAGGSRPTQDGDHTAIPVRPTHVVSWTADSPSPYPQAGPSRRVALAGSDNTIWIASLAPPDYRLSEQPAGTPSVPLPTIITSPTPDESTTPSPARPTRPSQARNASYASASGRSRAASSASSILTSASGNRRRTSAFSPPGPSTHVPTSSISSAIATAAAPDGHTHRDSVSERAELRDHLREQCVDQREEDERHALGLGIAGLGRRGLPGVHGKEEVGEHSGLSSPKSATSTESNRTIGGRLLAWGRGDAEGQGGIGGLDVKDRIQEVEVEREMEREVREEEKEKEDQRVVEQARKTPLHTPGEEREQGFRHLQGAASRPAIVRVVLPSSVRGKIVCLKVFEDVGLCVLRDTGLLDIISLSTLQATASFELETPEELASNVASSSKSSLRVTQSWQWRGVHCAKSDETTLLVAHGLGWPCGVPTPNSDVTRVIILRYAPQPGILARLELPGEGDVAVGCNSDGSYLLHATPSSLTSYPILLPSQPSGPSSRHETPRASPAIRSVSAVAPPALPQGVAHLGDPHSQDQEPLLRRNRSLASVREVAEHPPHDKEKDKEMGFAKFLAARRADWHSGASKGQKDAPETPHVGLGEGVEVQRDGYGEWTSIKLRDNGEGAGIAQQEVALFECDGRSLHVRYCITGLESTVRDAFFGEGQRSICVLQEDALSVYTESSRVEASHQKISYERRNIIPQVTMCDVQGSGLLFGTQEGLFSADLRAKTSDANQQIKWVETENRGVDPVAALHPLDLGAVVVVDGSGNLLRRNLASVLLGSAATDDVDAAETDGSNSTVTCIRMCKLPNGALGVAAGDEDGVIRLWDAKSFELLGSWTLFAYPVCSITLLDMAEAGVLKGSILCTSLAGTVGVVSLSEMEQLFAIPAARGPLRKVFVGGKDIMLTYANGKARVWNVETMEFRRSTGLDAAEDMLQSGEWAEVRLDGDRESDKRPLSSVPAVPIAHTDLGRLLSLDLRQLSGWLNSAGLNSSHSPLATLRSLLSVFLTFGVDEAIDRICVEELCINKPGLSSTLGTLGSVGSSSLAYAEGLAAWQVSSAITGLRQLVIITLLRPFLDSPDHERWAAEVIAFYTASLPAAIIDSELDFFAAYYLDSAPDVHQAAKMLFAARLDRMTESEIEAVVLSRQGDLPSLQAPGAQETGAAAAALTMIGGMALHKYQSINPRRVDFALKAVSDSLSIFLNDPSSPHLGLAIELTSKGFTTWQSYVDPMDLLRRLFFLSTHNPPSNTPSGGANLAAQARLAVLHVASSNPALFMSTLSMDILDAKSAEGRKSIMKLCVFMARKKPQVLEHSLPKIAEAVVKSLDPNVGKMREDVWQAATVILNELVLAFSTIDFNSGTQKLAVGTHEGAVVMFDLKSASRLYVIEPHRRAVSAVSFSPDGRRLITVSLDEGDVTVWKVGSSISGFFNVGGPPRQGGEKGEPFKRIEFMRADDGPLESTTALSDIRIEWPGPRQARVMIRETALTFET